MRIIFWALCTLSSVLSGLEFASFLSVALDVASGLYGDETPGSCTAFRILNSRSESCSMFRKIKRVNSKSTY